MRNRKLTRFATLVATFGLVFCSFQASPEDIDIFSVDEDANVNNPNILFVVDNSANWSRQSQQWPGTDASGKAEDQGQSEVDAISQVLDEVDDSVNIGLMLHITGGSSADTDHAYIRYHIRPMDKDNKAALKAHLAKIYTDINVPEEKRAAGNPYGNLFWDIYNYLAGIDHSNAGTGTPSNLADSAAYTSQYKTFRSPLTTNDTCARTVVVFIGNNVSTGPTDDSQVNEDALYALALAARNDTFAKEAVTQLKFLDYVVKQTTPEVELGMSQVCYASAAACTTANNTTACTDEGFLNCFCDTTTTPAIACSTSSHFNVDKSTTTTTTVTVSDDEPPGVDTTDQYTGEATQCQKNKPASSCTVPPGTTVAVFADTPAAGQTTTTYTSWVAGTCDWGTNNANNAGCPVSAAGKVIWEPRGTKHVRTLVETQTPVTTTTPNFAQTLGCYSDASACDANDVSGGCPAGSTCACSTAAGSTGCASTSKFMVKAKYTAIEALAQLGTGHAAPGHLMMDEWAQFLSQVGVPIPGLTLNGAPVRSKVTTYTIDVFNAQQNADFSALLFNAADVTQGKYFQAKDKQSLINALREILTEVQAVNSAFSSASLPVNATNRAQNENQVFIGVFKPDKTKDPAWFGNLKRYQLISTGASIDLGDSLGKSAINNQTGFLGDCAVSFWTRDSGTYWDIPINSDDPDAISICTSNTTSDWSDSPDGPFVEKGAVAEVLRTGNTQGSADTDGNYLVKRNVYTEVSGALADLTATNFDDGDASTDETEEEFTVRFIYGEDIKDEDKDADDIVADPTDRGVIEPRSSIHGDVVHSRPQPINYGGTTGVVVFYGSNDGHFRAVKASNGQELWSFVAPESFDKFPRLRNNSPIIRFFNDTVINTKPKDYFFDGSTGVFQNDDSSKIWIFPTLRRGGNRLYGLDVSDPEKPAYLWTAGCDAADCSDPDYANMGQTWALPNVAFVKGYCGSSGCMDDSTPRAPVIVLAGGHDTCEDENTWEPNCSTPKGTGVYVIDAETGKLLRYFDFTGFAGFSPRSVVADVALIDADSDEMVDYGYAVDTGGNIYRFDFVEGPSKSALDDPAKWVHSRVAFTNGFGRKFLFPPALVQVTATKIYLAVGTGDREHPLRSHYPYEDRNGDKDTTDGGVVNRFYVFKDDLADVDTGTELNLDDKDVMADYTSDTSCATDTILPNDTEQGWFMELSAAGKGEQVVTSAVVAAGFVFFSTNRPTEAATTACTTSLGEARGYFVNLLNASGAIGVSGACGGDRSSTFVGGGLPPSPVLATVPIDGELRTVVIGAVQKTGEPSSPIQSQRVRPPIASDRKPIYWYKSTGDK